MRAIITIAAMLVLSGCGSKTTTVIERSTVTTTVTATSQSAPAPAAGPTFSGNGTKTIGTVTVSKPSTIEWTCSGCAAFAFTSHASGTTAIAVSSSASSGTSAIDPGTYADAQVISNGNWTIKLVPG